MPSLLDLLRKKDPNMSLEDARNAMSMEPGTQFNFLGEMVPTEQIDQGPLLPAQEIAPAPPALAPLQKQVPQVPQIMRPPQEETFPEETLVARKPATAVKAAPKKADRKQEPIPEPKQEVQKEEPKQPELIAPKEQYLGEESEATKANLLAAQERANQMSDAAFWGKIGSQIGGALGHQSKGVIDRNIELAGELDKIGKRDQEQLMQRIALEKQDPNSRYSMAAKNFIEEKFKVKLPEGISAEALDKTFMSPALKAFEAEETRKATIAKQLQDAETKKELALQRSQDRTDQIKLQASLNAPMRELAMQQRQQGLEDRNTRQASQQLEVLKRNAIQGGGVAGNQIRNKIQFADNLFGTVGADPMMNEKDIEALPASSFDHVNRTMVAEMAIELNRLLSSTGTPAQATLEKLIPRNILMDKTKIQDYVTSELNPAQQGEFIKQALKTGARIKEIGKRQNKELMSKYFAGTERIKKYSPDDYSRALAELGLEPEDIEGPKKKPSKKLMDRMPNAEGLKQKFDGVKSMSEEELDEYIRTNGLK